MPEHAGHPGAAPAEPVENQVCGRFHSNAESEQLDLQPGGGMAVLTRITDTRVTPLDRPFRQD